MPVQVRVLEDETLIDSDVMIAGQNRFRYKTLAFALPLINIGYKGQRAADNCSFAHTKDWRSRLHTRVRMGLGANYGVRVTFTDLAV